MAHMDRISMGYTHGVHDIRFQARARAPDLVLPPRDTGDTQGPGGEILERKRDSVMS